jgi:hypothetical protein
MARGIFERPKGSGIWWVRYTDQYGKLHREKVGPKSLAKAAYQKRKTEIREGKFFPEKVRQKREMLFCDMVKLYLEEHAKVNKLSWKTDRPRLTRLAEYFGDRSLSEIKRQDVERLRAKLAKEFSQATVNRHMALVKLPAASRGASLAQLEIKLGRPLLEVPMLLYVFLNYITSHAVSYRPRKVSVLPQLSSPQLSL